MIEENIFQAISTMKILLTGGAGFIGSHLADAILEGLSPERLCVLDRLSYAGSEQNLQHHTGHPAFEFARGDIRSRDDLAKLQLKEFDAIIHAAAETHVDRSIAGPADFIEHNIRGTFSLLEELRLLEWQKLPGRRYIQFSTDEVYGEIASGEFTEQTAYAPRSPYSASKASADHLALSYAATYAFPCILLHPCNAFGPRQHSEKFIPTIIRSALNGKSIPVYGAGNNTREWIYAPDLARVVTMLLKEEIPSGHYNLGSGLRLTNIELARRICSILDLQLPDKAPHNKLIEHVADRPGHDLRYALDSTKLRKLLEFPASNFDEQLGLTIKYYRDLQGQ